MEKIFRHPWIIVLVIAAITIFFAFQIPRLEVDNNNFRFISENDPARLVLRHIDDTFGSSVFILVALEQKTGDVFNPAFLSLLREYVEKIEAIEIVDPVTSMITADFITGDSESITVEKLLPEDFSGTQEEISRLKEKLLSWDIYKKSLISEDLSSTQILVPLNVSSEDSGKPEVVDSYIQVREIAREMFSKTARVYVTGIPVISATINEAMLSDLSLLVPLVAIVVFLTLFFSFRKLSGVVLPLLTVAIAAIWSMGAMSFFNVKLSVISTVLPVILIAVGSAYGIHVITRYLDNKRKAKPGEISYRELVIGSAKTVAKPVFLAAITTLAGFLSFCFTTVLPIREFGFFAGFGVLVSLSVALTLIPALLVIAGPPKHAEDTSSLTENAAGEDRFSSKVSSLFSAIAVHKGMVIFVAAIVIAVSLFGASFLVIDNVFIEYFKSDTDIAKSDRFIREQFGGSKIISVVAEADKSETLLGPGSLLAMDNLNTYLETKIPEVGKTMGFTDLIKRINQVFNADESPLGIGIASGSVSSGLLLQDSGEDIDFGFGSFGFDDTDDFGFGDTDDFGFKDTDDFGDFEKDISPPSESVPQSTENVSMEDIVAVLSKALRSGNKAELNAFELVEEVKKLLNYEGAAYYEIPGDPAKYGKTLPEELSGLVSNYLILLSGNIESYANDPLEPTAIKTTIQLRALGESDTNRAVNAIYDFAEENFPEDIKLTVGGTALVESSLNRQVVKSQIISLFVSLAIVFLIVTFSNKSIVAGLIGIIPIFISILINFAVMAFMGIKLNIGTSMIASLVVGIGIDYTIHYMESFKRENHGWENLDFLKRTFAVSGKAIIINALSVGMGFAVLVFSNFNMLGDFGLLVAITMGTSSLVSLTVIPALLLTFKPSFALSG